jgi:hypothetical protein
MSRSSGCATLLYPDAITRGKAILEEIVKMLFKMLDQLGCRIAEESGEYGEPAEEGVEKD